MCHCKEEGLPPDGGWGWMVVFASFMIHVINDGVTYSFGVFYNDFLEYFRDDKSKTAWILSILSGMTLCSGPLAGILVKKFGCRSVTIGGTFLACFSLFVSYWGNSITVLCITIGFGAGSGFGLIYLPAIVSVTMYFEKKRALATGIAVCGSGIGTLIFPPVINVLLEHYYWRGTLVVLSGIVLECIIFGMLFRPLEIRKKRKTNQGHLNGNMTDFASVAVQSDKTEVVKPQMKTKSNQSVHGILDVTLFKDVIFVLFLMSNFLTSIGFNIPYVYIVAKATSLNITATDASLLLSVIGIANTLGRIILGYVSDKPWVNRLWVYNSSLAICGLATALSAFALEFYSLVVYVAIFGFTVGAYVGLTSVILVDLFGLDKMTNAFGILLLFQGVATFIGPPIGGLLYDRTESYDVAFYLSGIAISLSGLMLFTVPAIQRKLVGNNNESSVDQVNCE